MKYYGIKNPRIVREGQRLETIAKKVSRKAERWICRRKMNGADIEYKFGHECLMLKSGNRIKILRYGLRIHIEEFENEVTLSIAQRLNLEEQHGWDDGLIPVCYSSDLDWKPMRLTV